MHFDAFAVYTIYQVLLPICLYLQLIVLNMTSIQSKTYRSFCQNQLESRTRTHTSTHMQTKAKTNEKNKQANTNESIKLTFYVLQCTTLTNYLIASPITWYRFL